MSCIGRGTLPKVQIMDYILDNKLCKRLFSGTLPTNKKLFAGTLSAFKKLFAGTLLAKKKLFAGNPAALYLCFPPLLSEKFLPFYHSVKS